MGVLVPGSIGIHPLHWHPPRVQVHWDRWKHTVRTSPLYKHFPNQSSFVFMSPSFVGAFVDDFVQVPLPTCELLIASGHS